MSWIECGIRIIAGTVLALFVSAASASADPPGRVARISFIGGSVSFRPSSLDEWSVATVNFPLTTGDHVWTDRGGRSELELGSMVVRIAPYTEFSVLNLDDQTAQLRLTQGTMSVRVRNVSDGDVFEIDTPNGAVSLLQPGLYRIDVNEAGDSIVVTVRQGEAQVAAGSTFSVLGEQSAVLTGVDAPQSDVRAAVRIDEFEDWCLTRDHRAEDAQTARYVSPGVIGYEDLDANGSWVTVADYGPVWVPRVGADWAPYRFGHWAWVDPWGWTWIDDASWGFAPFHYGRWAFVTGRGWAWVPGTVVARPVYAPALVAFVGGSSWGASFQIGGGPVAWFPLGPREVFVPTYHVTPVYAQRVNVQQVTNVNITTVNVTNVVYVNRTVPGAVTAVSRDTFIQARPVASATVAVSREQLRAASVVGTAPQVAPQRVSVAGQPQARVAPMPPPAVVNRQVVVRTAPPPPSVSFAAKEATLSKHPGQPVDEQTERTLRAATPQAANSHPFVKSIVGPGARAVKAAPAANAPNSPAAPPARGQGPAVARQGPPASASPDLAARHAKELADINTRHAQERAALEAKHQQAQKQLTVEAQRAQLNQQHLKEVKALQDRQALERLAVQKRQEEERKNGRTP